MSHDKHSLQKANEYIYLYKTWETAKETNVPWQTYYLITFTVINFN